MKKIYILAVGLLAMSLNAQILNNSSEVAVYNGPVNNVLQKAPSQIFNQQSNQQNGYGVVYFNNFQGGLYTADDFEIPQASKISKIKTYGFTTIQPFTSLLTAITEVNFYIFEDNQGKPSTLPDAAFKTIKMAKNAPGLSINVSGQLYEISVDLTVANQLLELDGNKRYWLAVAPSVSTTNGSLRYAWFKATDNKYSAQTHFVDPDDLFEQDYTRWTALDNVLEDPWGDFGSAFTIEGENLLGISESYSNFKALVHNDRATNKLNIVLSSGNKIISSEIYDANGRKVITSAQSKEINTSSLKEGIYFIVINTDKGVEKTKFIK